MRNWFHTGALRVFGWMPQRLQHLVVRLASPTFTMGTAVVVRAGDGRILLVRHPYSEGWGLPGGLLDRREEPRETAAREILEELGLRVAIRGHPVAVRTPWRRHFNLLFTVALPGDLASDEVRPCSPEISATGWFEVSDLPDDLAEFTDEFLAAAGVLEA